MQMQGKIGSKNNTIFVSKQIERTLANGSRTANMARTVLNSLKELTNIKNLSTLNEDDIKVYVSNLQERVTAGDLSRKTTATYISALNNVINYTNTFVGKNHIVLQKVHAKDYGLSAGRQTPCQTAVSDALHEKYCNFLIEKYKQSGDLGHLAVRHATILAKEFGLRFRESISIKLLSKNIEKGAKLEIGILDGTKNGKPRFITITTDSQVSALKNAQQFMKENNLKSLITRETRQKMTDFAYNGKRPFNKSAVEHSGEKHLSHGERRTFSCEKLAAIKSDNPNLSDKEARQKLTEELGHGRIDVTYQYVPRE